MVVVIPAYNPDYHLIDVINNLKDLKYKIVVVNDGSNKDCNKIFNKISKYAYIVNHNTNMGKGMAMKTGIRYIKDNLKMIGNKKVSLEEVDLSVLDNYERNYEEKEMIVSSLRIDNVVSGIINTSRKVALDKIKNKEVVVNYGVMNKNSYILKESDIFSIRRYGKYKFVGIVKSTKKNNFIVRYLKYI